MNGWVDLIELQGRRAGHMIPYHKHAAQPAIDSGYARRPTQEEIDVGHALDHMNPFMELEERLELAAAAKAEAQAAAAAEIGADEDDDDADEAVMFAIGDQEVDLNKLDEHTKGELLGFLDELGVDAPEEGTGANGNVLHSDLVKAVHDAVWDLMAAATDEGEEE